MIILKKDLDRDFVILNITDPQLDDAQLDHNHLDRVYLFNTIRQLVSRVKPQLITISGDFCYGDCPRFLDVLRCFGDFIESFQIPWAIVWGNHDNQGGPEIICRAVEMYQQYPHFLYESGDPAMGNGNYVIEIQENGRTIEGLIMMDTHNRMSYTNEKGETVNDAWAKLLPTQLQWYEQQVKELQTKGCNETILVTHIPIFAYREAIAAALRPDVDPKSVPPQDSSNPDLWNEGYKDSYGVHYEQVSSYPTDEGAMNRILQLHSTKVVICGHDHVDNWVINYKGVQLTYSLKTGRGCYFHKDLNGGTVLTIDNQGHVTTHHEYVKIDG